jgi:hypothetical protein
MARWCPDCGTVILEGAVCKTCGTHAQALPLKRKRSSSDDQIGPRASSSSPSLPLVPKRERLLHSGSASYVLIHTLGLNSFQALSGDGAYSEWLQNAFTSPPVNQHGCIFSTRMVYEGKKKGKDDVLMPLLNQDFARKFKRILDENDFGLTSVIILNWHLRKTGRSNAWSGRGVNRELIEQLTRIARLRGFKLIVVYTIHEMKSIRGDNEAVVNPSALVALNPTVHDFLTEQFHNVPIGNSQVPGFMTSLHTSAVDHILSFLPHDTPPEVLNTAGACLLQTLKLQNQWPATGKLATVSKGIVVFGMISKRHGTTVENLARLCRALDQYGIPQTFKVVVIGKVQDPELFAELNDLTGITKRRELAALRARLVVHGELAASVPFNQFMRSINRQNRTTARITSVQVNIAFNPITQCRYAISFDELGYRDNASAMVNMTRAGNLLFSRENAESNPKLIDRCVRAIVRCTLEDGYYTTLLAAQQPRFRATEPTVVALRLSRFFGDLARTAIRTGDLPGLSVFSLNQTYIAYYGWALESAVVYCQVSGTIRISGRTLRASGRKVYVEFVLLAGTITEIVHGSRPRSVTQDQFASLPLFLHEDFLQ